MSYVKFVLNRSAWKMALEDARAMNPNVAQPGQQVIYPHTLHGGYAGDVLVNGGQYGEFILFSPQTKEYGGTMSLMRMIRSVKGDIQRDLWKISTVVYRCI